MNWQEFKQQVAINLPMDNARIGIATGNPNYFDQQLLNCIIGIQKLIPFYQQGHETIYGADDVTRDGLASVGSMPRHDQCRPRSAYYRRVGKVCVNQPMDQYPWDCRSDLVCGNPRLYGNQYLIAIDEQGRTFYGFPSIGNEHKIVIEWDGVKLAFADDDDTPFETDVAECVSLFIKSRLSRLVDHDLAEADSYERSFLRARAILFADSRTRNRLNKTANSPTADQNCANTIGICTDSVDACGGGSQPVEDTVEFCAFGDSGEEATIANTAAVSNLVKSLEPDFIMHLGDIVYPSGQPVGIQDLLLKYYGLYIPEDFLFTFGNHDIETDNGDALEALFTKQAALNQGKRYYSYTHENGKASIWVIDSNTPSDQDMWDWLQEGLSTSTLWNIITMHKSPFTSDVTHAPGDAALRKPYKDWGANLVISAHGHNYERLWVDDLTYIVCGLGGAQKRGFVSPPTPGSQMRYNDYYGSLWVTARDEQLQVSFFNTKGDNVDSVAFQREPAVA